MRMTRHTDYALRMLIYLASRPGQICTVSEVADAYRLSRNHLLKVALRLGRMGAIQTMRGRAGGIRLAKEPDEINLGELVRQTEDDFSLVECCRAMAGPASSPRPAGRKVFFVKRSMPILPFWTAIRSLIPCAIPPASGIFSASNSGLVERNGDGRSHLNVECVCLGAYIGY